MHSDSCHVHNRSSYELDSSPDAIPCGMVRQGVDALSKGCLLRTSRFTIHMELSDLELAIGRIPRRVSSERQG